MKGEGIMVINDELIDKLLRDYEKPEDLLGEEGILKELTHRLVERALEGEMTSHLGYEKYDKSYKKKGNFRNGHSKKALKGDFGEINFKVPRDRQSDFDPKIVAKGQTRFTGFDDKIISMYARGMTTRDIQGHLEEIYQVEVSPTLISTVTNGVMDEVREWQSRPLDGIYQWGFRSSLKGICTTIPRFRFHTKVVYLEVPPQEA